MYIWVLQTSRPPNSHISLPIGESFRHCNLCIAETYHTTPHDTINKKFEIPPQKQIPPKVM